MSHPHSVITDPNGVEVASTKFFLTRAVKTSGKDGQESLSSEQPKTIEIHKFLTQPAGVYVEDFIKMTKDYQSASITVGVYMPCYVEDVEETKIRAVDFVATALNEQMPDLIKLVGKLGS